MSDSPTFAIRRSAAHGSVLEQTAWVAAFSFLTAVGAQIEIPNAPVPYTLQTFFVLLAGGLLGSRNGFLSMSVYLLAGLAGLPVFSQFGFGLAKFMGPTGGYLLAFPVAAYLIGVMTERRKQWWWIVVSLAAGLVVIFTFGTMHLAVTYTHSLAEAFAGGFLIFSWWDVVKLSAVAAILGGLQRSSK